MPFYCFHISPKEVQTPCKKSIFDVLLSISKQLIYPDKLNAPKNAKGKLFNNLIDLFDAEKPGSYKNNLKTRYQLAKCLLTRGISRHSVFK